MAAIHAYPDDAEVPFGEILHRMPAAGKGIKHVPLLTRKCGFSFDEKMHKIQRKAQMKLGQLLSGDEQDDDSPAAGVPLV